MLEEGASLPRDIKDFRLGLEIAVIIHHARKIADLLVARDPLSQNVKLGKTEMLFGALAAAGVAVAGRLSGRSRA